MKFVKIIIFLFLSAVLFGEDSQFENYGSLLFAENCLGCHQISSFTAEEPDIGYVKQLTEDIDYMTQDPSSPMADLSFLSINDLREIARFLIYGSHVDSWISEDFHGAYVEALGDSTCMKCHDNNRVNDIDIPSCKDCH